MKRKLNILVILLVLASVATMQSCKKQAPLEPVGYVAAMPTSPSPVVSAIIPFTGSGQAVNLTWAGSASSAVKWTVYFGTSSHPPMVAENVTTNSYTAHIGTKGGVYYWMVETTDAMEVYTASPVWNFDVNSSPLATNLLLPANNAVAQSITPTITWNKTKDPEGDALTYDLYLGTSATAPASYSTALADTTFTVATALTPSTDYYWKVVTKDPYGGSSVSPIYKFTTGALPIAKFVAAYNVNETSVQFGVYPTYTIIFTKVDNNTIKADNWWDSGWTPSFVLDFTKNTIVMTPFTVVSGSSTYICTGSGKITQATGAISFVYNVTKNGVLTENGTELFTLKKGAMTQDLTGKQPKR